MESILGRPLEPFEEVHHINGITSDDRPENLELWVVRQPVGRRASDFVAWLARDYPEYLERAAVGLRCAVKE